MPRNRQNKRERLKAQAKRRNPNGPVGRAKERAEKAAERRQAGKERAIQTLAAHGNGWAFGGRVEAQFLTLARYLATIFEAERREAAGLYDTPAERLAAQERAAEARQELAAAGFEKARLGAARDLRTAGFAGRWDDPATRGESGPPTVKLSALANMPRPGAWVRLPGELGRLDLLHTSLPVYEHISIGHAPGDMKEKRQERTREIRFYHFEGDEIDPHGDRYSRLVGHIPGNWPERALREAVRLLIDRCGQDPRHWTARRRVPKRDAYGRHLHDASGAPEFVTRTDFLFPKLKNEQNKE
jgi:hypothetical protein